MKPDVKIRYIPEEDLFDVEYELRDKVDGQIKTKKGARKVPAAFFENREELDAEAIKSAMTLVYMIINLPTAFLFGRMNVQPDAQLPAEGEEWHLHDVLAALARQNEPSVSDQGQNVELTHALFAFIKEHHLTVKY